MTDIPINTGDSHSHNSGERHVHVTQEQGPQKSRALFIGIVAVLVIIIIATVRNNNDNAANKDIVAKNGAQSTIMSSVDSETMTQSIVADNKKLAVQTAWLANFADITYKTNIALADVTGGNALGKAGFGMIDGAFHMFASFENLPPLTQGYFYEGWLVRKEPLSIISTGALVDYNGGMVNAYLSRTDLTDHTTYVLTLEPSDGDPSPAEHILEGTVLETK